MVHLLDEKPTTPGSDICEMKTSGRGKDAQRDVYLRGETAGRKAHRAA